MDLIWFFHDQMIHEGSKIDIASFLKQVKLTFNNHVHAWENSTLSLDVWSPPPKNCLKANFNLSLFLEGDSLLTIQAINNPVSIKSMENIAYC